MKRRKHFAMLLMWAWSVLILNVQSAPFDTWEKRMEITFSGYTAGREALTDFPVLVVLSDGSNGVDFTDFETGAADLRFTAADEVTELNYEIETWNDADSKSWIWVQVDPLTNNTTIYAYWGRLGETAPSYTTNGATWSNGYLAVWHMQDASNAPSDSALLLNDNSGTDAGTDAMVVSAKVGRGYDYAATGRVDIGNADDLSGLSESTVTLWYYKRSQGGGGYGTLLGVNNSWDWGLRHHITDSLDARLNGNYYNVCGALTNAAWHHLAYVYDDAGNSLKGFLNGSAGSTLTCNDAWLSPSHLVGSNSADDRTIDGILDEVRFASVLRSADWIWAEFMTMSSNDVLAVYGAVVGQAPEGAPRIENAVATNVLLQTAYMNGNLTSTGMAQTTVFAHWGITDGITNTSGSNAWASSAEITANASTGMVAYSAMGLTPNRVYYSRLSASNSIARTWSRPSETFMTSEVWVETTTHASEVGLVNGHFTVHRHADATNTAFSVDYTVGGTATGGTHYVTLGGRVTFAEGDADADITVTPLKVWVDQNARTVDLTLLSGPYIVGVQSNATITVANESLPGGATNVWTASASGNASVAGNWSLGHTPVPGESVLLMGAVSTVDLAWDAGASETVAEWVQDSDYTGTVTFETVYTNYGGTFTNFMIIGDCVVKNGTWTHLNDNSDSAAPWFEHSRLCVTVGADFDLSGTARINVSGRGFHKLQGPGRATASYETGSHGGYGFGGSAGEPYGSVIQPERCGSGGGWYSGGGAVYLDIGGSLTVGPNATIMAEGDPDQTSTGAGGSIYIRTGEVHGSGIIEANGGHTTTGSMWRDGGGGRVAVVLTDAGSDFSDFPEGNIRAWSGTHGVAAGAGTVYLQTGDQADGAGRLVIDNNDKAIANLHYSTLMPDGVNLADFAEVTVSGNSVLAIDGDNPLPFLSLNLSVEGPTASYLSIYNDAQVTYPDTLIVTNYSLLIDNASGTLANVVIESDGVLSHSANGSSEAYALTLTLSGDLTVKAGGAIDLLGKGYYKGMGPGGMSGDYHAGSYGGRGYGGGPCYGSILNPDHLGSGGGANPGGGKARLTVAGTTTVEIGAKISANGLDYNAGSGGTIHLTTDTLAGAGIIEANGGSANNPRVSGGGGRVAVYLTGSGQTFHSFTNAGGTITAYGNENTSCWDDSAAGTVYLQTQGDAAGAGTCIIDNNGLDMFNYTELPPTFSSNATYGAEYEFADDLSDTTFLLRGNASVQVMASVVIGDLVVVSNAWLDLSTNVLYVDSLEHDLSDPNVSGVGATNLVSDYSRIMWIGQPAGGVFIIR